MELVYLNIIYLFIYLFSAQNIVSNKRTIVKELCVRTIMKWSWPNFRNNHDSCLDSLRKSVTNVRVDSILAKNRKGPSGYKW